MAYSMEVRACGTVYPCCGRAYSSFSSSRCVFRDRTAGLSCNSKLDFFETPYWLHNFTFLLITQRDSNCSHTPDDTCYFLSFFLIVAILMSIRCISYRFCFVLALHLQYQFVHFFPFGEMSTQDLCPCLNWVIF